MQAFNSYVKIQDLVSILIQDSVLLRKWLQFSDCLQSPSHDKIRWGRKINTHAFEYYEIFSEILQRWTSLSLTKRVGDLCQVLREIQCTATAEFLENNFRKDDVINYFVNNPTERAILPRRKSIYFNCDNFLQPSNVPETLTPTNSIFPLISEKEIKWPITFGVLVTTSNFSGREEQLDELNSYFNSNANLVLICGFGGIGKTEFCKKFANTLPALYSTPISTVWLHGDTFETLRTSVSKLAKELGITNEGNPQPSEYFEHLASKILEKSSRLLVILDNVDTEYDEVMTVIKLVKMAKYERMFVIVTSRNRNILGVTENRIELEVLSNSRARTLLQKSISNLTDSDADLLCKVVQYYPLALQQALAYIKQQREHIRTRNYSAADYVKEFETKKSKMLDQTLSKFLHSYSMTTLLTWDLTLEKLSETAVNILKILAHFEPDAIDINFFEEVCENWNLQNEDFYEGLDMIHNYSLIKIENDNIISIHRLVQDVIRHKINDREYSKALFDSILLTLTKLEYCEKPWWENRHHLNNVCKFAYDCAVDDSWEFHNRIEFLIKHDRIDCAVQYTKIHFETIEFTSDLESNKELIEKVFLWYIVTGGGGFITNEVIQTGEYYLNSYCSNSKYVKIALNFGLKYFDKNSEMIFKVKNKLAKALGWEGEYEKALTLCEEIITSEFHEQQKVAYKTMRWSGESFCREKNYGKSFEVMERVFKFTASHLGKDHRDTLNRKSSLAEVLYEKGEFEKSLELFQQLYDHFKQAEDEERINWYSCKVIQLQIKLHLLDESTKEDIVNEFFHVKYSKFPLRGLEIILPYYSEIFGLNHQLTIEVKNAIYQ